MAKAYHKKTADEEAKNTVRADWIAYIRERGVFRTHRLYLVRRSSTSIPVGSHISFVAFTGLCAHATHFRVSGKRGRRVA